MSELRRAGVEVEVLARVVTTAVPCYVSVPTLARAQAEYEAAKRMLTPAARRRLEAAERAEVNRVVNGEPRRRHVA